MVFLTMWLWAGSLFALEPGASQIQPFLPTGSMIRAVLATSVYSQNLEVPLVAEATTDARYCDPTGRQECADTVFPAKTRFIGRALVLKSHDRVNCIFYLAVLPDGREIPISAMAVALDGTAGLPGKVTKYNDSLVASMALRGAIAGAASMAGGAANPVTAGASEGLANAAMQEVDLAEKVDISIEVPAYTLAIIYLKERIELEKKEPDKEAKKQKE